MRSLSADRGRWAALPFHPRTLSQQAATALVSVAATTMAAAGGALAATSANLAMVAAAGVFGAACLTFASSFMSLLGVLVIRGVTDAFAADPIVAGLNAGAVVGLVLVVSAAAIIVARLYEGDGRVRGLGVTFVALAGILYWFGIAVLRYGMDPSLVREVVRTTSILAVGLIAANSDRSVNASRMGTIVVLAAMIPAVLVVNEALTNWQEMVGGGLRPRGSMSHPNAAAILFGIGAPIAMWKFTHDRAGQRYLYAAVFLMAAVFLTRSMGGFAQLVVAMLVLGALQTGRPIFRVGVVVGIATLIALFVFDPLGISRVSEFESTDLSVQGSHDNSFEWRLYNWYLYLEEWEDARLLGHGLGSSEEIISPIGHLPHSDPIRFLVEIGVVGATLMVIAILAILGRLLRIARGGTNASFAIAALAALAGVGTHALVTHVSFNTAPAYVLAALLGWLLTSQSTEDDEDIGANEGSDDTGSTNDTEGHRTARSAAPASRRRTERVRATPVSARRGGAASH